MLIFFMIIAIHFVTKIANLKAPSILTFKLLFSPFSSLTEDLSRQYLVPFFRHVRVKEKSTYYCTDK